MMYGDPSGLCALKITMSNIALIGTHHQEFIDKLEEKRFTLARSPTYSQASHSLPSALSIWQLYIAIFPAQSFQIASGPPRNRYQGS